ncbi:hypothetical protein T310_9472, partial [Rasamsonia emersonii CBS 393.64]
VYLKKLRLLTTKRLIKKNSRAPNTPPQFGGIRTRFRHQFAPLIKLYNILNFYTKLPLPCWLGRPISLYKPAKKIFVFPPPTGAQSNHLRKGWELRRRSYQPPRDWSRDHRVNISCDPSLPITYKIKITNLKILTFLNLLIIKLIKI